MFDHRAVTISFKDPTKVISQPTISRELLTDPDLEIHVALAVADTYLIHSAALTDIERTRLSQEIGTAKQNIRSVGPDNKFFQDGYRSELENNMREGTLGGIRETIDNFPFDRVQDGDFLEGLTPDIFLEALINNIRNECVSYQIFLGKTIKSTTSYLQKCLAELKLPKSLS